MVVGDVGEVEEGGEGELELREGQTAVVGDEYYSLFVGE